MKLNISYPATGAQKLIEVEDEKKLHAFMDKRISAEVEGDSMGEEYKGYIFRITGGHDKQGFAMRQGVLVPGRVRLLLPAGTNNFATYKRKGERTRRSVRGCIVASDLSVLHLAVVKKGEKEIEGLTDRKLPLRLGPKRASKIVKLFNLPKGANVQQHAVHRPVIKDGKKVGVKTPKVQRLITPERIQRKRRLISLKHKRREKSKAEAEAYAKLLAKRRKDIQEKRQAHMDKKRAQRAQQRK